MNHVFITGDRTPGPLYPVLVAVAMLRAVRTGVKVYTGTNGGVEQMVREYARFAGIDVIIVENQGDKDWQMRAEVVHALELDVVFVHVEPHASNMLKGHLAVTPDEALTILTHSDLMV